MMTGTYLRTDIGASRRARPLVAVVHTMGVAGGALADQPAAGTAAPDRIFGIDPTPDDCAAIVGANRAMGGLVGGVAGGLIGSSVGKSLDRADPIHAGQTQTQALEFEPSGHLVAWQNPDTRNFGSVTPPPTYRTSGSEVCRDYSHDATIDGRYGRVSGTACRDAYGQWRAVGS